jgi:hypothetical protein
VGIRFFVCRSFLSGPLFEAKQNIKEVASAAAERRPNDLDLLSLPLRFSASYPFQRLGVVKRRLQQLLCRPLVASTALPSCTWSFSRFAEASGLVRWLPLSVPSLVAAVAVI